MRKEKKHQNSVFKKSAIIGGSISALYLLLGDISYKLSLSRKGLNSKLITDIASKKKAKKPADAYIAELDAKIAEGQAWLETQPLEKIGIVYDTNKNLHADLLKADVQSNVFVICIHGYNSSPHKMGLYAREFHKMGYHVLLPSMRGHADSEEEFITMGWKDRLDIMEWIRYICEQYPDCKIILHGVSMGGATVMMTTGEKLPSNVKLAIEDCGYTTAWEILGLKLTKSIKLPKFPFLYGANAVNRLREKFNLKKASSVEQLKKSVTPTLFIHGEKDTFVPFSMLDAVYEAAICKKKKLSVPDAPHARSACAHPELYWPAVKSFIKLYI